MKKYAKAKISRRQFLSGSAAISATAVAAVVIPNAALAAEEVPVVENKKEEGYRLTQHIADYYKSASV